MIKAMKITHPSKRLTDPDFKYRPACKTDLSKTFAEARARMRLLPVIVENNDERQQIGHTESA